MKSKILIVTCIALNMIFLAVSCKESKKEGQSGRAAVSVVPYSVQSEKIVYYDSYPGTATALNEVQLRSEVSGFVTGMFFREGSQVNKGLKLYEIDRRKYQAAFEEARANVEIASANLQKAQRDADRYKKLDEQNAIAKQILDDALTSLENARMQYISSKASLLNAETDFNYSLINAPFTGTIGFSQVKPGAFVTAGQTLLNTMSADDPIGLDFITDEKSLPYFQRMLNNEIQVSDSAFKLVLPDNSDYNFTGKLSIIGRAVDPLTGTIRIRVIFPNSDRRLRPGMNCKIMVLNENSGLRVTIPTRALIEQMSEYFVYVIDNGTVRQKRIELGPNLGETVIVQTGLNPGDKIVLEGLQKVHEGSAVITSDSATDAKTTSRVK